MRTPRSWCIVGLVFFVLAGVAGSEAAAHVYELGKGKQAKTVHPGDTLHVDVGDTLVLNVTDEFCKAILTPSIGSTAIASFKPGGVVESAKRTYKIKAQGIGQTTFTLQVEGTEVIDPEDDDIECSENNSNDFTICVSPKLKELVKPYAKLAKQKKKELTAKLKAAEKALAAGYKSALQQLKQDAISVCQAQTAMATSFAQTTGTLNPCWFKLSDEVAAFGAAQIAAAGNPACAQIDSVFSTGSGGIHDEFDAAAAKCLHAAYQKMRSSFRKARDAAEKLRPGQLGASIVMTAPAVVGGPPGPMNTEGLPPGDKPINVTSTIASAANIGLSDGAITLFGTGAPGLGPASVRIHGLGVDTTVMATIDAETCQWTVTVPDLPFGLYGIKVKYEGDKGGYSSFLSVNEG